ncbi:MAG: NADH-quinone oxidoreductase subunit H [Eubacterium sp.]|nr:NADH-quinone oxidoreductase subunit H [Eubacterium xylanophilum]MCR5797968.1 NADH-quinone oxidoreductase subunit H [Eubacterium sp.]
MCKIITVVAFIILAPFIGGLLDGIDRKLSARMQGRKGPSVLQPFYDLKKLFDKQFLSVNKMQLFMVISYLIFMIVTGAMFFAGMDLLMCFFVLSTVVMFLILASSSTHSPFASIGTHREMMQMMSYEPMVLLTAIGFYLATGSFKVEDIIKMDKPAIIMLPGFFLGFVYILTIKFRKSPFDLSASHHAHQEIVRGITVEMVGPEFALTTLAEWYEYVFLLGIVGLFFVNSNPISYVVAVVVAFAAFFLEILIDNTSARVKWQLMFKLTWIISLVCGGVNLLILEYMR